MRLIDFSIAQFADELAADQADRGNLVKGRSPTGGFHKRHMVGLPTPRCSPALQIWIRHAAAWSCVAEGL